MSSNRNDQDNQSTLSARLIGAVRRLGGGAGGSGRDRSAAEVDFTGDTVAFSGELGGDVREIEIFRGGVHTAMTGHVFSYSDADLEATAAAYDPRLHEAPLVIGHPSSDRPAFGWVRSLKARNGRLFATIGDLDPAFSEQVKARRFAKVSASFYRPDGARNPVPGIWYLKHVGFLGAAAPAVAGMDDPVLHADGDAEAAVFAANDTEDLARQMAELQREKRELQRRVRETESVAFVEGLLTEGRTLPVFADGLASFMQQIDEDDTVSFSEGGETKEVNALDWFKSYLKGMPVVVPLGGTLPKGDAADFAGADSGIVVPKGYSMAPDPDNLVQRANDYAKKHNIGFEAALQAVLR